MKFSKFLIIFLIMIFSLNHISADNSFKITAGIDIEANLELTFDRLRTISGVAKEGTVIIFQVYQVNNEGMQEQKFQKKIILGSSGIFSETISLGLDTNYLNVTVQEKDEESQSYNFIIKRKSEAIKRKIVDQQIILPDIR